MDRRFTESHLRGLKLLAGLSSAQLQDISHRLKPARFRQAETIIQEGQPGDEMYFIESGQVRVLRTHGAQILVLAEMGAGDLFGEMALLTGKPRSATVTALTDVNLWVLGQSDFDELVTSYPTLALALSRLLSDRLSSTDAHILQQPAMAVPAAASLQPAAAPVVAVPLPVAASVPQARTAPRPRPAPKPTPRPTRAKPAQSLTSELGESFNGLVGWFGSLSRGAKVRLIVVSMLLVWLVCIVAPAFLNLDFGSRGSDQLAGCHRLCAN